ncbi:hypothetical protein [Alloalcanivorax dieselolei]|uniref:hypothetical protein n=1 Tax=Alloalcanivorax dieselolei TaxID=285091 RepID=UPI0005A03953|nr:hypothetical protein [Alloalcanivorax dieselolei]
MIMYSPFTETPPLPHLSKREKYWLRLHLSYNSDWVYPGSSEKIKSVESIVEDLADNWNRHYMSSHIRTWKEAYFLPNNELSWISADNDRQLIWLLNELNIAIPNIIVRDPPPSLFLQVQILLQPPDPATIPSERRYHSVIATIDAWAIRLDQKREVLDKMRQYWDQCQITWSQIKWLNKRDISQLNWAIEYINKSMLWKQHDLLFSCRHSSDPKEKYTYILGFLDHLYRLGKDSQELFTIKMRKTWSQKKYRESEKAKKQVYFSLSDEARRHLEQLEKARKQSKNRIIEDLLSQAVKSKPFE